MQLLLCWMNRVMRLEINLKRDYGVIKHNMSAQNIADILSLLNINDSLILFSFYERNMNLVDASTQKFILDRSTFVNSEWVLPWKESLPHWDEVTQAPPKIIWFYVEKKEDIVKAIEIDHLFRCIFLQKDMSFKQYSNVVFHQEYYSSVEEEEYEYYLGFTNKEAFLTHSLDKIKSQFEMTLIE